MSPNTGSSGDSITAHAFFAEHYSRDAKSDTTPSYTLLTGKRLVNVLDTMDYHHELLKQVFTAEQDPFQELKEVFEELCHKLRQTVSPEVQKLFVTSPTKQDHLHFDYQTRRRVWDSIYKRIEAPIGNPYRFTNISSHRHIRLDDQVRGLLSEEVRNRLPTNMDDRDRILPKKVQASSPGNTPRRSGNSASDRVIPGSYANDDIIHSPTAQATARPRAPISEVYDSPLQGELLRPTKIGSSTQRAQEDNYVQSKKKPFATPQPQTPKNRKCPKPCKSHRLRLAQTPETKYTSPEAKRTGDSDSQSDKQTPSGASINSTTSVVNATYNDTDWDEYATVASQHREDCSLCRHYKMVNAMVAEARAESTRRVMSKKERKSMTLLAAARVRDFERIKDLMKKWDATNNPAYDPSDSRLWSEIADLMTKLLCESAKAEKQAMANLLQNFRVTTFVPEDRDNHYSEANQIACPIVKELPLTSQDIGQFGPMPDPQQVIQYKPDEKQRNEFYAWFDKTVHDYYEKQIKKQDAEISLAKSVAKGDFKEDESKTIDEDEDEGFWDEEDPDSEELDLEIFQ
ncbi:hypothetical protein F5B19DRAFT_465287 [Rostrohypoxylon terebratum]|nr:hypothetical protein F5B19DRAFT_465287 [Rostrohypoxylon terebratum]